LTTRDPDPSIQYWLPLVVWIAAILAVSSIPGPTLALVGFSVQDKIAHASEYSVMGFLTCRWLLGVRVRPPRALTLSTLMGAGLGAADESWQRLIPGRECSARDWVADVIGIALGVTAAGIYYLALRSARGAGGDGHSRAAPRDADGIQLGGGDSGESV
jgi:VanZ family protein